jgi:hypothetical protein
MHRFLLSALLLPALLLAEGASGISWKMPSGW